MLILNTNRPPPLYPGCYVGALVIRFSYVPGNTLVKCHGSHSKDRKDKYNDKYMGIDKDKYKDRQRQECRRIKNNCRGESNICVVLWQ